MKLKVQHVMDATLIVSQIIREQRPMPQKGKYLLARLHAKLLPEFTLANEQRDAMITAYGYHPKVPVTGAVYKPDEETPLQDSPEFAVPASKMEEFLAVWKKIADEEIEIDVQPIPLLALDLGPSKDGSIEAHELITLGELVTE